MNLWHTFFLFYQILKKKSNFLILSQFNSVEYYLIYGKIFIKYIFNLPVGGIKKPPEN